MSGVESRWGRVSPPVQTGPEFHPAFCKMITGSFPGSKVRPWRAADHSPPSSAAVMEEYSYTSTHRLGHTGPVMGSLYILYMNVMFVYKLLLIVLTLSQQTETGLSLELLSENFEKRQLSSSCLFIRLFAQNKSAPTGRIFMAFDIWGFFFENISRKVKFH